MAVDLSATAAGIEAVASERVSVEIVTDRSRWDALYAAAPFPHLTQSWAYGEGKAAGGWIARRAVFTAAGRPVALAQVLEKRVLGLRLLSRVNRGPVFLEAKPDPSRIVAVYRALNRHWWGALLIAPTLERLPESHLLLRRAGFVQRQQHGWRSGRIDLTQDEDGIWRGFASGFRNRARNAEKAGATVRIADDDATYAWMLARHHENMREKSFHAVDARFLLALRDSARAGDVTVFQLIARDGEAVAGMSVVRFGTHCEYHVGWFGPRGREFNAGNTLMWAIMREMKRRGCTSFDVGGMSEGSGYTQFKRTMRPAEYELDGEWVGIW